MQTTNDDMDELFRDAAENYPLKVTGANWNKVKEQLENNTPIPPSQKKASNKKWLWLLVLLPIPMICNYRQTAHLTDNNKNLTSSTTAIIENNDNKVIADQSNKILPSQQTVAIQNNSLIRPLLATAGNSLTTFVATTHYLSISKKQKTTAKISTASVSDDNNTDDNNTDHATATPNAIAIGPTDTTVTAKIITNKNIEIVQKPADTIKSISTVTTTKKTTKSVRKLYVSIIAGPDFSKVKSAEIKHISYSYGAVIGYAINKHFSVEAGALYSLKNYTAYYKDFDNSKTAWSTYRIIKTVDGTCRMIEIPVSVRYNFAIKNKSNFFAAVGLSSYLMKKENYDYDYTLTNGGPQMSAYRTYKNAGNKWLNNLELSAGWQRNISHTIAVRVQPYYNVSLQGVGIGSVNISGAGLLAGLSIYLK